MGLLWPVNVKKTTEKMTAVQLFSIAKFAFFDKNPDIIPSKTSSYEKRCRELMQAKSSLIG